MNLKYVGKVLIGRWHSHILEFYQLLEIYISSVVCFPFQASMLTNPDGPFINVSKLNLNNYAQQPKLAKVMCSNSSFQ